MANKKSALKELRKTKKRTAHNNSMKTHFKHLFRECTDLIQAGETNKAKEKAIEFQQIADKAAKRHIISKNRVNRKKAALMDMLHGKREVPAVKGKTKVKTQKAAPKSEPAPEKPEEPKSEPKPETTEEKTA